MPNIIKNGISYIPKVLVADGITIINSEGVISAVQQELPLPDGVTIVDSEGIWSAIQPSLPTPDGITIIDSEGVWTAVQQAATQSNWNALEGSEGFILNKPALNSGTGENSIIEGTNTVADGKAAHAEGKDTIATGEYSHTEGIETSAVGKASHVEGYGTVASGAYQHVQGKYNVEDTSGNYADIVGWGYAGGEKNISALTTDGSLILKGNLTIGANDVSGGGYTIPVPAINNSFLRYNSGTIGWDEYSSVPEVDNETIIVNNENKLATARVIYDGSEMPTNDFGNIGDIYFKHS